MKLSVPDFLNSLTKGVLGSGKAIAGKSGEVLSFIVSISC